MSQAYRETVAELESRGMMPDRAPSLAPMREALGCMQARGALDREWLEARTVVIAGTNGKGSVCATLEALLTSAGERVGLYTSPHLIETTERIRIDGKDISPDLFVRAYRRVLELTADIRLTHFELLTLMAVWAFASGEVLPRVDRILLEVGLGGTWDATNAVPHRFGVITALGLDHQNLLGNSLPEIARNKLGIVTEGATLVHTPFPAEVRALADSVAREKGARFVAAVEVSRRTETREAEPEFWLKTPWGEAKLALPGARGAENAATALAAFRELGFNPGAHLSALARVRWPGRMEKIPVPFAPCPVYVSGDHNPQGVASLLELLPDYRREHIHLIVGIGRDKDLDGILTPLFALPNTSIYLTETPFRGRALEEYGPWREQAQGSWANGCEALAQVAARAERRDLIVVTGSLYLVGAIKGAALECRSGPGFRLPVPLKI